MSEKIKDIPENFSILRSMKILTMFKLILQDIEKN